MQMLKEITLEEALEEAFENRAVITSDGLEQGEFLCVLYNRLWYEDAGCLGYEDDARDFLFSMEWTRTHRWYVITYLTAADVNVPEIFNEPTGYRGTRLITERLQQIAKKAQS